MKTLTPTIVVALAAGAVVCACGAEATDLGLDAASVRPTVVQDTPASAPDFAWAAEQPAPSPAPRHWAFQAEITAPPCPMTDTLGGCGMALLPREEDWGYFERQEYHRQFRRVRRALLRVEQHALVDWTRSWAGGWLDAGEISLLGPGEAAARRRTWLAALVVATEVDMSIDASRGADVKISYSIPHLGPDWFTGAEVEVDPTNAELAVVVGIRRGSLQCSVNAAGDAQVAWSLPY